MTSIIVGVIFLTAGLLKAPHPEAFSDQILRILALAPDSFVGPVLSRLTIAGEVLLGSLLLFRCWPRISFGFAIVASLLFAATILRASAIGERDCGCFGEQLQRSPEMALLEDGGLFALAVLGLLTTARQANRTRSSRKLGFILLATGFTVFSLVIPLIRGHEPGSSLFTEGRYVGLIHDTSTREGSGNSELNLREGEQLVILLSRMEDTRDETIFLGLTDLAEDPSAPPVLILIPGREAKQPVFIPTDPPLPVYSLPAKLWRGLSGKLPRTLFLFDGTISRTWDNVVSYDELECSLQDDETGLDFDMEDVNSLDPNEPNEPQ